MGGGGIRGSWCWRGLGGGGEGGGEGFAGPVQFAADGVRGLAGEVGDFGVAQFLIGDEEEEESVFLGHAVEGGADAFAQFLDFEHAERGVLGGGGGVPERVVGIGDEVTGGPAGGEVAAVVDGDAIEPGAPGRLVAELGEMFPGFEEDIVGDVLGAGGVAEEAEREIIDGLGVLLIDGSERLGTRGFSEGPGRGGCRRFAHAGGDGHRQFDRVGRVKSRGGVGGRGWGDGDAVGDQSEAWGCGGGEGDEAAGGGLGGAEPFDHFGGADEEGGGEGVGFGGGGEDHGGEEGALGGSTGAGVDDVAVEGALMGEALAPDGGDGEGFVVELDDGEWGGGRGAVGGMEGGIDGDAPGVGGFGGAEGEGGAGAAVEEGIMDVGIAEDGGRAVDGVAFADGAEVEAGVGVGEADGEIGGVEEELPGTDGGEGGREGGGVRRVAGAADEAPGLEEGADGDVEGAVGCLGEDDGVLEEVEDLGGDLDGMEVGEAVEGGDFAFGAVGAEGGVEALDFGDGFLAGGAEVGGVGAVEDQFEAGGHRLGGEEEGSHEGGGEEKRGSPGGPANPFERARAG